VIGVLVRAVSVVNSTTMGESRPRCTWHAHSVFRVVLSVSVCVLTLLPFASAAVGSTQPPDNDNFLDSVNLNSPNSPLNSTNTLEDISDTIGATVQSNIFAPCGQSSCRSGPAEVSTCAGVSYGKTVWYDFYPDHDGQVEIRTAGIPNVIALYRYDTRTLAPHEVQCASGSKAASNELFATVHRGVAYTYQIGGRNPAGGSLKMQFNYAYSNELTVTNFRTAAGLQRITARPGQLRLVKLEFTGLTRRETVSYACAFCQPGAFGVRSKSGNIATLKARSPSIIGSRSRFIVAATSPAQIGRFRLYAVDVTRLRERLMAQGCLAPGVRSVSAASAADPSSLQQVPCPAPAVNPAGGEYVFWTSPQGRLMESWYAGQRWSPPMALKARRLGSAPTVAIHADGEQDVFWRGRHGDLWDAWYKGRWNGPVDLRAGRLGSAPSAGVDAADDEYVFWQGTDGGLWEKLFSDGSWSQPVGLNAGRLGSAPSVAIHANGEQDVFWRGTDGNLWEMWYTGRWNGPVDLGAGRLGSAPTAGVDAAGNVYVFWRGTDGGLWEKFFSDGSWSQPVALNAGRLGSAPTVAIHANGEQDVFWRGTNGRLRDYWYTGKWNGPVSLGGGRLGSGPSAGVEAVGKQSSG
jgi:hypothetical protein